MTPAHEYPWNVRIGVGGTSFTGPGMDTKAEAESIKTIVESEGGVQSAEVFRQ